MPNDILEDAELFQPKEIEILRRWECDASEISAAEDEGMAHATGASLEQILQVLHQLVPDISTGRSPPAQQGGFDRAALKLQRPKASDIYQAATSLTARPFTV